MQIYKRNLKFKIVGVNTYKIRYRSQRLDAERELERLNKLGIRTPIAPSS